MTTQQPHVYDLPCGEWLRDSSAYYSTNAFSGAVELEPGDGYAITITKENGRYIFFAEEHETEELIAMGYHAPEGYRTLKECKKAAQEFGYSFEQTYLEAELELALA